MADKTCFPSGANFGSLMVGIVKTIKGFSAIWVPETGIIDYRAVANKLASLIKNCEGDCCKDSNTPSFKTGTPIAEGS